MEELQLVASCRALERTIEEAGLALHPEQVRALAQVERTALIETGRLSFGEPASVRLVRSLAHSSYLAGADAGEVLAELVTAFYDLREDCGAETTDEELVSLLSSSFEQGAAGVAGIAHAQVRSWLASQVQEVAYELTDDEGRTYRWDPDEWRDDVMADGWLGERWEDVHE